MRKERKLKDFKNEYINSTIDVSYFNQLTPGVH